MELMSTVKVLTGTNVEELEIIRRAIYIAGRQAIQTRPKNKDELREQFIKNGGHVEQNDTAVFFDYIKEINGFTNEITVEHYTFSKILV